MFKVKFVPIDVINYPQQYDGKKLRHPVFSCRVILRLTKPIELKFGTPVGWAAFILVSLPPRYTNV